MTEIWKDIPGYEGIYQVSNLGQVRSLNYKKTGKIKLLKLCANTYGYYSVTLRKNNFRKTGVVHRLVAITFIENENNLPCINHKDENKLNNNVNNLEWCDYKYNINYGTAIQRGVNKRKVKVNCYNLSCKLVKKYNSIKDTKNDGFIPQCVYRCCRGITKTHLGYRFEYA